MQSLHNYSSPTGGKQKLPSAYSYPCSMASFYSSTDSTDSTNDASQAFAQKKIPRRALSIVTGDENAQNRSERSTRLPVMLLTRSDSTNSPRPQASTMVSSDQSNVGTPRSILTPSKKRRRTPSGRRLTVRYYSTFNCSMSSTYTLLKFSPTRFSSICTIILFTSTTLTRRLLDDWTLEHQKRPLN